MSTNVQTKINQLLQSQPPGVVFLASWLEANGYSRELQRKYINTGWLQPVGRGALIRTGQVVDWTGALYSLQTQAEYEIHVGGRSALSMMGMAHYLELKTERITLFASRGIHLPAWFRNYYQSLEFMLNNTEFLPAKSGLSSFDEKSYSIKISGPARACLECLYLSPGKFSLTESFQLIEGMTTLLPEDVQELLEKCNSVKTVRLFLFMASKAKHAWVKHLDMSRINAGKGKRSIIKNGVYIPEYQITIPIELSEM